MTARRSEGCLLCHSSTFDYGISFNAERRGGEEEIKHRLLVCTNCGLGFLDPQPTSEYLARELYNEGYGLYSAGPSGRASSFWQRAYRYVFPHPLLRLIPEIPGKALDVGCGGGYWMRKLSGLGWDVTGLDMTEKTVDNVRSLGFAGVVGSIEDAELDHESFDLVLLSAVMEHLHDPFMALRNVWSSLKPGGYAVIDVPNFGSIEVDLFGDKWSLFGLGHLFYFTEASLRLGLENAGFVPEVFLKKTAEMTFEYSLARKMNVKSSIPLVLASGPFQFMLNSLNESGELFCRARKPA